METRISFLAVQVTYSAEYYFERALNTLNYSPQFSRCFLFRGAPDIVVKQSSIVHSTTSQDVLNSSTSKEESGQEIAIDNSHQRPALKGYHDYDLPEK